MNTMARKKYILKISRYDLDGNLLETYRHAKAAAIAMDGSQRFISYAAEGKKVLTAYGYIWRRGDEPKLDVKPILKAGWRKSSPLATKQHTVGQYDLEGNLVATYRNTKEAGKAVGFHYQGIRLVMRGEGLTYGGFVWSKEIKKKIEVNPRIKADPIISQYDLDGKWLRSFSSPYVAWKETGISNTCIGHVIQGNMLTAGKYIWREGRKLRINVNELKSHPHYPKSALERHMTKKRRQRQNERQP